MTDTCPGCDHEPGRATFSTAPEQSVCTNAACPVNTWDPSKQTTPRLYDAFIAGFKASGEGYNAEYPYAFEDRSIRRELREKYRRWRDS